MAKQHRTTTPVPTQPKLSRLRSQPRVSTTPGQSGEANPYREHKLLRLERFLRDEFKIAPGAAAGLLHHMTLPLLAYVQDPQLFKSLPDEEVLRIGFSAGDSEHHAEWLKLNKIPKKKWPAELIQYLKANQVFLADHKKRELSRDPSCPDQILNALVNGRKHYYAARNKHLADARKSDSTFKTHYWIKPVTGRKREKALREFGAAAVEMSRLSKRGDDYGFLARESRPFERPYQEAFQAFIKLTGQPDPDDRTNELYDAEMEPIVEVFEIAVEAAIEAARPHKSA